jgi:hypothetical protein
MEKEIGKPIIYVQAPCFDAKGNPLGEITSEGEQETKEGSCHCYDGSRSCCVDSIGIILPHQLREEQVVKKEVK